MLIKRKCSELRRTVCFRGQRLLHGGKQKSSPVNQVSFVCVILFYKAYSDLSFPPVTVGMDLAPSHN